MNIPEISEVERFQYKPGDRFILHCDGFLDEDIARTVVARFRAAMQLPTNAPVAIFDHKWDVKILGCEDDNLYSRPVV